MDSGPCSVTLRARCKSERRIVSFLRRAVLRFAKKHCGFAGEALDDIELAVGEALANAAEHGHSDGGWISMSCSYDDNNFRVIVSDSGPAFDYTPRPWDPASELRTRGFGLRIMRSTMDEVCFESGGRIVKLTKLHALAASAALETA